MPTKKPTRADLERQLAYTNDALEMALALSPERDNNFFTGGLSAAYTDRNSWDRKKVFSEALRAWRVNPLARRLVSLTRQFVLGKGISISSADDATNKFLQEWWSHRLNKVDANSRRWLDEQTRTGNLFFLVTVNNGFPYVRVVPSDQIAEIKTKDNDIEQETHYLREELDPEPWPAYDPAAEQELFILHYAINKPVGSAWGESDLAPLLPTLGRYSTWLEDRIRLNHFRNAFMYIVRGKYKDENARKAREMALNMTPPKPGSVLVTDEETETWGILRAALDSFDASMDGLSIKKYIAAGWGVPLHYLAEPESATRTTAEAAGTPAFRQFDEIQDGFFEMLVDLARVMVEVRARYVKGLDPKAEIKITGPDITERDNANLALAVARIYPAISEMFDRDLIDEQEFVEKVYRMMADAFEGKAPKGKKKPLVKTEISAPAEPAPAPEDKPEESPE